MSIQAHPDKKLAEILHKSQPDVYKDDNHKPEMVLAVSEFEALCGFITLEVTYLSSVFIARLFACMAWHLTSNKGLISRSSIA